MRTELHGTSNAVLTVGGEFVAIIECRKSGRINDKIERAVKDHFPDSVVAIIEPTEQVLNNTTPLTFSMELIQDQEDPFYRDFELNSILSIDDEKNDAGILLFRNDNILYQPIKSTK